MSYVIAVPELMTSAATDLATIGSNVNAAHMVAAARTTAVIPAAADEVSTGVAQLFSQHAASYQAMAAQAAAFQEEFVQHLTAGAFLYTNIEAAIAAFLQDLQVVIAFEDAFVSSLPQYLSESVAGLPPQQAIPFLLYILPFIPLEAVLGPIVALYLRSIGFVPQPL
jgi:hypothetical protein